MNYFRYKLISAQGNIIAGIIKLPYQETMSAMNHLERDGSMTLYVRKLGRLTQWLFKLSSLRPQRKIPRDTLAEILNNLALMLRAGMPLVSALEETAHTDELPDISKDFDEIIERIKGGAGFSEAAQHYPHIFHRNIIHLMRMGESTGNLDEMLKDASQHLLRMQKIVSDTKQALLYPSFVLTLISGGIIFWFAYVVPKIVSLFDELDVALPTITRLLIAISEFVQRYYLHGIVASVSILIAVIVMHKKNQRFRKAMDFVLLQLPIVKSIITASILAFVTEYFAMLMNAGITILESINILKSSVSNEVYRDKLGEVLDNLEHGKGIADSFKLALIFPTFVVRMISVGESSGTLTDQLVYIAEDYRNKLSNLVATIGKSIEPLILIVAGTIILVIIIGLFLPIYDLVSSVSSVAP